VSREEQGCGAIEPVERRGTAVEVLHLLIHDGGGVAVAFLVERELEMRPGEIARQLLAMSGSGQLAVEVFALPYEAKKEDAPAPETSIVSVGVLVCVEEALRVVETSAGQREQPAGFPDVFGLAAVAPLDLLVRGTQSSGSDSGLRIGQIGVERMAWS